MAKGIRFSSTKQVAWSEYLILCNLCTFSKLKCYIFIYCQLFSCQPTGHLINARFKVSVWFQKTPMKQTKPQLPHPHSLPQHPPNSCSGMEEIWDWERGLLCTVTGKSIRTHTSTFLIYAFALCELTERTPFSVVCLVGLALFFNDTFS